MNLGRVFRPAVMILFLLAMIASGCSGDDSSAEQPADSNPADDDDDDDNDDNDNDDNDDNDDSAPDDDSGDDDTTTEPVEYPLTDDAGRTLILHGANFMPIENNGQPLDYRRMTQWGFNVVRIVITWDALEPEPGVWDETYLPEIVEPQVEYAAAAGIRVMLNMHQYHWSPCCGGMGMPEWTCADLEDSPLEWIWQSGLFWNHEDYLDGFVAAWDRVAEYFAGDERIFAYDLFNEPLAGLRTAPWIMDDQLLRPLYERLIATIRARDSQPWLVIEPSMLTLIGIPFTMEPLPAERLLYGPHLYPGTISEGGGYTFPREWIERHVDRRQDESLTQGLPLLIGETGLASSVTNADLYARDVMDLLEEERAHFTWWIFHYDDTGMGLCDAAGEPKPTFYRHLARPFPPVTSGRLREFHFDESTRVFTVAYDNRAELAPGVEIFVAAETFYPEGFTVASSDADETWQWKFDAAAGRLTVTADPQAATHQVTIEPAVR